MLLTEIEETLGVNRAHLRRGGSHPRPLLQKAIALITAVFVMQIITFAALQTPAAATTFHQFSRANETSAAGSYTGVALGRYDATNFTISSGNACSTPYASPVVYQTEWVLITSDGQNWIELGTGHGCNGYTYWYWGYGYQGNWYSMGTQAITPGGFHGFYIYRLSGNAWTQQIDGTAMGHLTWATIGNQDQIGLESWDGGAKAPSHTYTNLIRTVNQGSWQVWAGFDAWHVDTPVMCGGWNTASEWRASENSSC